MAKNITFVEWSATGLPDGLSIDRDSGVISGTPTVDPGTYTATIKVETNYGEDEATIQIVVAIPNSWKPVIDDGQTINVDAGEEIEYTVLGTNVTKTA